jgi:transcriptional regulator with XRE-family HTH domain
VRVMQASGITKAELARRMGVSKARVTNLLSGMPNMTLRTLAVVAVALGGEFRMSLARRKDRAPARADVSPAAGSSSRNRYELPASASDTVRDSAPRGSRGKRKQRAGGRRGGGV